MGKYFGTDGFRGEAGVTLTSEHAYKIGRFLGWYYGRTDGHRVRAVIGKDTRRSSYMFEYAIVAGLTASGADVYMLHVTTTPSVSFAVAGDEFDCGIMISASHNPYTDNGIKLVNKRGEKIDDNTIAEIEKYLDGNLAALGVAGEDLPLATGADIGKIVDYAAGRNRYIGYLISLSQYSFKPFRVGLDCANGSAWMIAKSVFEALGAKVHAINVEPNGLNINREAGSTHIEVLAECVKREGLDIGFAFDGDADRCIAVDERGEVVNGDHILYLLARHLQGQGALVGNTVVTTVMSNLGLYRALDAVGIRYEQTTVGDRFIYENMQKNGYCIGGEQSGHVILSKYATTGDGILTAIKIMEAVISSKQPLSKLAAPVKMFPQITRNVRVDNKAAVRENGQVQAAIAAVRDRLGSEGRILLRESGTEPVVRVMVEAASEALCRELADGVVNVIYDQGLAVRPL
ncbi:MAG: phosphoglucosamine mutase [Ruminococcaceae bacterium]|nr:phosphoglucosamine mutase [Oscillospiraceae bacterium]